MSQQLWFAAATRKFHFGIYRHVNSYGFIADVCKVRNLFDVVPSAQGLLVAFGWAELVKPSGLTNRVHRRRAPPKRSETRVRCLAHANQLVELLLIFWSLKFDQKSLVVCNALTRFHGSAPSGCESVYIFISKMSQQLGFAVATRKIHFGIYLRVNSYGLTQMFENYGIYSK